MESFSVIFYETPNGEQPAKLFLNELSEKQRAKTIRDLKLLETCGNKLREPTSKFLESGIYELRTKQGSNISRILYFFFVGKRIVVNVNIRMYNFDDVQCTVIPSVAYGFVTGMNLQLC